VWKDQPYDNKSDVWSLGCVLYEAVTLVPPFRAKEMSGLYKKVTRGIYQELPETYSRDLARVISYMLQVNPKERSSCEEIL
jgi:NIMA (never in mitosis gene a)-related kinase